MTIATSSRFWTCRETPICPKTAVFCTFAEYLPQDSHTQSSTPAALLATAVHTTVYLAVTGLIAWVVYSKLGLAFLRKGWINLNLVWAAALVVTSVVTLLI
jgi:hypothetical protein